MEKMDEEKQRMAYESYFYKQQLGAVKKEMERITLTMLDITNAVKTIDSMKKTDSLVPIGGNAFIETKLSSERVLVPIGGGYVLKMDREMAKTEMEKRAESTKKVIEKLQNEYERMVNMINDLERRIRE
ncbi:MAG: prefoldin subunit alpha [Candidatus ainarchaeum sp.]|nr:prefoldin subunit alpha [Candidatus ainarchaeum sp.]